MARLRGPEASHSGGRREGTDDFNSGGKDETRRSELGAPTRQASRPPRIHQTCQEFGDPEGMLGKAGKELVGFLAVAKSRQSGWRHRRGCARRDKMCTRIRNSASGLPTGDRQQFSLDDSPSAARTLRWSISRYTYALSTCAWSFLSPFSYDSLPDRSLTTVLPVFPSWYLHPRFLTMQKSGWNAGER